jgi:hypothetical protein
MPYDPGLAERLEEIVADRAGFERMAMFGGIGWLMYGNMCVGIWRDWLIARVGVEAAGALLRESHVKPMDITGKPMKGWVMVGPDGLSSDGDLLRYTEAAVAFVATLPQKP